MAAPLITIHTSTGSDEKTRPRQRSIVSGRVVVAVGQGTPVNPLRPYSNLLLAHFGIVPERFERSGWWN